MKNYREVTEQEFFDKAPSRYYWTQEGKADLSEVEWPLVLMTYDTHDRLGKHVNAREWGRITYVPKKQWLVVMSQEEVAAHNKAVMKAVLGGKNPAEVQERAEREEWEQRPHTYEDKISVNGVATPFCKHYGNLISHETHNKGMTLEKSKSHLADAAKNRTMGIGIEGIMKKQQKE